MGLQAVLLTSAALTAEVKTLKENLERSENELGHAKKQLKDKEGEQHTTRNMSTYDLLSVTLEELVINL